MEQPDSIRISGGIAEMLGRRAVVATVAVDTLLKLYRVQFESGLFHGEERFAVAVFPGQTWVVPPFTPGLDEFWRACMSVSMRRDACFEVAALGIPWAWRKRVLGFLPIFPIPRLGILRDGSLPSWLESGIAGARGGFDG